MIQFLNETSKFRNLKRNQLSAHVLAFPRYKYNAHVRKLGHFLSFKKPKSVESVFSPHALPGWANRVLALFAPPAIDLVLKRPFYNLDKISR